MLSFDSIYSQLVSEGNRPYIKFIPNCLIASDSELMELLVLEDIVFIGYPNGICDTKNFTPLLRNGKTATPLSFDYNGYPYFLIDASVFPGSSGSPVVICNVGTYPTISGIIEGTRFIFLGILSQVFYIPEEGKIKYKNIPSSVEPVVSLKEYMDLGLVIKAKIIKETVELFLKEKGVIK